MADPLTALIGRLETEVAALDARARGPVRPQQRAELRERAHGVRIALAIARAMTREG